VAHPIASVVVRSQNSVATIEEALSGLRRQTIELEIVVVDSGSTDGTLAVAGRTADRIVEIPPHQYRPGHALNIGTNEAAGEFLFALSSHCRVVHDDWAERALAHYGDRNVAGVASSRTTPDGRPLTRPYRQRPEDARLHPYWGFSNHASSWRRSAWERFPFDERILIEDREWALRVLDSGLALVFDPYLWVEQRHRWRAGAARYFTRERRENRALAEIVGLPAYRPRDLAREWLTSPDDEHSRMFHLLNYRRAAGLLGKYAGLRGARR
jgi:rhamnosyltransferase